MRTCLSRGQASHRTHLHNRCQSHTSTVQEYSDGCHIGTSWLHKLVAAHPNKIELGVEKNGIFEILRNIIDPWIHMYVPREKNIS